MSLRTCRTCGGLYAADQYTCPKCHAVLDYCTVAAVTKTATTDAVIINEIEAIRAKNNKHWMDLVRLAFELAPDRARGIMQEIQRLDGEVRRLTQELAR